MATRAEVAERYAARTGVDVAALRWYEAFAMWKTAVVLQQLYLRWAKGESTDPRMAMMSERIPMLAHGARDVLAEAT
jgi:aminoglycoside phosphotransferase (APT) family kinase protein